MASPKLKVKVQVGADVKGALSGFRRVAGGIRKLGAEAKQWAVGFGAAGAVIGGAAVAAGAATFKLAESQAKINDEMAKSARRFGMTTQSYAELAHVADLGGVTIEEFRDSIKTLNLGLGQFSTKEGTLYSFLTKVSPKLRDQVGAAKDAEGAFGILTEALELVPDAARKSQLLVAAFGETGYKMATALEGGAESVKKARSEFVKFYGPVNNGAVSASEAFIDSQARMKLAVNGAKAAIANGLIPVLQPMVANLAEVVVKNRELIATKVGDVFRGIAKWMENIDWQATIDSIFSMTTRIGELGAGFIKFASDAGRALQPFVAIVSGLAHDIDRLADSFDLLGILDDRETRMTGDAATMARVRADKAKRGGPSAPVPTTMQRKFASGVHLADSVGRMQTQRQDIGGKIEIVVKSDPGLATRTESVTSTNAAVPIKASNTGRRSTGSGRP